MSEKKYGSTTHGLSNHRLYYRLGKVKDRCRNPKNDNYPRYGAKGIDVCKEWDDFQAFYDWSMANGYKDGLTLDRIDNDGPYSPGNCRWATMKEQSNNKRNNIKVLFDGELIGIEEAIKRSGITKSVFHSRRYHSKWPIERCFIPIQPRKKK